MPCMPQPRDRSQSWSDGNIEGIDKRELGSETRVIPMTPYNRRVSKPLRRVEIPDLVA